MNSLIVGLGEIGTAVMETIEMHDIVYTHDINGTSSENLPEIDVLHVCFPPSDTFVEDVEAYINQHDPSHVIVWSSTSIGTCSRIADYVIHTPVEGKHPRLSESIQTMVRWVGCLDRMEREWAANYFMTMSLDVREVEKSEYTEALKLISTSEYGVNIVFADYKKNVADILGMDYELMTEWNRTYNDLYRSLRLPDFQKFVLDPPGGKIGGHCITQNAELLHGQFPHEMLRMIREMKV